MKKTYLTFLFALISVCVLAVPAKRGLWKTVKLADGTEVRVELCGDEYGKFWRAADGKVYVETQETGVYELSDMQKIIKKAGEVRKAAHKASSEMKKANAAGNQRISYTGKKKGLIILAQFKDTKFKPAHTLDLYKRIINEIGFSHQEYGFKGSVKDYFLSQSYGQMVFDFDVVGPVTLKYSYKYYGQNDPYTGNDKYPGKMITEACELVDDQIDFSQYDWDGNKDVEQVFVIYAGHGEASYRDADTVWPHKSSIYHSTGKSLTLDGVRVDTYACSCELGTTEKIDGIGTVCHEFSHCLGLPDFYYIQTHFVYGVAYGTGEWDLMCAGSYNDDSFCPAGYTAYERMSVGWLNPTELKNNTTVDALKPIVDNPEAYIIYNDNNKNEYFLLENRQPQSWDAALPGAGLLITHVDYDKRIFDNNYPNSPDAQAYAGYPNPHERCAPFFANNDVNAPAGHVYPYNGNNSLTNTSSPAAKLYNSNTDGTFFMNKPVTEIKQNADGTMSFVFENNNKNEFDYDLPETYAFYESFDKCNGAGGNDGTLSGSAVGKGYFYTDMEGWQSDESAGADRCAMFGSVVKAGKVTTPALELNGECTLMFKAAPYTGDGNDLTISVAEGEAELSGTAFTMKEGNWNVFEIKVTGTGAVKLELAATKRFFLDKVCFVQDPSSTGIDNITSDSNKINDGRIYSIDGRYVGNDMKLLKKGIYIVNGKKVLK